MGLTLALVLLSQVALHVTATSKKVCRSPLVFDGIDVSPLKRAYEVGEEVTLRCEPGYLSSNASILRIICTPTGLWTTTDLICVRICCPGHNLHFSRPKGTVHRFPAKMCPIPKPLQHLAKGRTEAPYKTVLNFICDEGHVMLGANNSRCLQDSTWSHPPPLCKAVNCPLPKPPNDGRIIYDKPITGTTIMYGQGWTYECNLPKAPSYERGYCKADGSTTEPPVCREVSCPVPTGIPNGFITFAVMREHGYKDQVKYSCNEHYILDGEPEIQCQNTGTWSAKPVCKAPCTVEIKRGRIFYNSKNLWIENLKPNRVLHGEDVGFYCLEEDFMCSFGVLSTCDNGTLPIPACFKEPDIFQYHFFPKSLPSEITMCFVRSASPTSPSRSA